MAAGGAAEYLKIMELASLIKDNLYSKHIVLSTEEALITLLQHHYHSDHRTLELLPTSSYNRLLLHRLADIYGFAHESVGEGDDRHLVLQRCPETAIPPVLVSDVLWKHDDHDGAWASVVLSRNETDIQKAWEPEDVQETISVESFHLKTDADPKPLQQSVPLAAASLKEREAAYRAARDRIFSTHDAKGKDASGAKSRHVPAVAQRMIAHALGKRVENPSAALAKDRGKEVVNGLNILASSIDNLCAVAPGSKEESSIGKSNSSSPSWDLHGKSSTQSRCTSNASAEKLKKEQTGAAKRMFAHALRLPGVEARSDGGALKPK